MFDRLLIHDTAASTLIALASKPPQGILLAGPRGIGKSTIATLWAHHVTGHATRTITITPDDKGTIPIETIRELYKITRNRQEGQQAVIIENAEGMSIEAQNAFLKLLEEPRAGLTFILTTLQTESLLSTMLSRIPAIALQPLPDEAIRRFIVSKKPGIADGNLAQLVFLAQGRPGIAAQLTTDNALLPQRERMQRAKHLVSAKPFERFELINRLAADRDNCIADLEAMSRIVEVQLKSTTAKTQLSHWLHLAQALETALQSITHNGNVRAQLLLLFSSY